MAQDGLTNFVNFAGIGKMNDRVGAKVHGGVQLFQFFVNVGGDRGVADVGVDLAQRSDADTHRLQFRMIDVGGNDHASTSDFVANQFGRNFFPVGDIDH